MKDFQENKSLVLSFYDELDSASGNEINEVLRGYTTDNYHWRGMHPFYEQRGAEAKTATPFPAESTISGARLCYDLWKKRSSLIRF